jgi:hypothetical protein
MPRCDGPRRTQSESHHAPANNVTFFNVGLLNSRLSATSRPLILRREVASNFFMIIFLSVHAALHVCICCHASRMRHHITAITDITDRFVCGRGRASGVASAPETVELLRPPETSWSHECCIAPASALPRPEWVKNSRDTHRYTMRTGGPKYIQKRT